MTTETTPEREQRLVANGIDRDKLQRALAAFGAEAVSRRLNMGLASIRQVAEDWGLSSGRDGNPDNLVLEDFLPTGIGRPRGVTTAGEGRSKAKPTAKGRPEPLKPGIEGAIQGLERERDSIEERLALAEQEVDTLLKLREECNIGISSLQALRR